MSLTRDLHRTEQEHQFSVLAERSQFTCGFYLEPFNLAHRGESRFGRSYSFGRTNPICPSGCQRDAFARTKPILIAAGRDGCAARAVRKGQVWPGYQVPPSWQNEPNFRSAQQPRIVAAGFVFARTNPILSATVQQRLDRTGGTLEGGPAP